ncbi:4-hydroxy-3-methylbut-2-enyl diphosphate reductase IspH [Gottschalkia acidurici 9a]|uniref:4-hydroxy-3-methylbut-2-enyl diphosphate reductase n=1 Tax=Gottschalkia acidurici (strain ATCC 7906 / DSM 604 / BCRC 14475 / CIP 104303 / KCTC 5404 / NCIMB 10678 / 9a) TaxID=1128398 RepID=K0B1C2_GOTA9|nr:bifunctional 4-hydroxy-3-methylbut-2-enyl diphosphate reductase/30S ribosomal protein S1 [Gottschalkia acidurici]AFS78446.1 4-hydroxy-3-methylbut-2-enyl diphosphate reductase IspH [Gottschalkia acidurici 9a]
MKVLIAKNSGFCFGVKNAIDTTMNIFQNTNDNKNVYSLGPLIHNNQAIEELKKTGLEVIDSIYDVGKGKVIIRSHGVPLDIYDIAEERQLDIVDCTCLFVRKIQKKVNECYNKGKNVVIIGDRNHPEVIGINGWCNNKAYIVNSEEDVNKIPSLDQICIVAQTTITNEKFETLSELVSKKSTDVEICNTICNATHIRQNSCKDVSQEVDAMIVIGGYHSSNTQKLVEISKMYCKNVYHVETADELPLDALKKHDKIGITAGASTPTWIIEEVYDKMVNISEDNNDMAALLENSFKNISKGDIVKGQVISIGEEVVVNIGYKSDGIITKQELTNDLNTNPYEVVKIGEQIDVLVLEINDGEGNVLLSKKRVDNKKSWQDLEGNYKNEDIITVKVTEVVNGGIVVNVKGLRGFIPASQVSNKFIKDLNSLIGRELDVKIIEFNKEKNRIVMSRKIIESEEIENTKERVWSKIKKGQKLNGKIKRLADFGAFIDIGGVDGLAHISDLSWSRLKHPSEVVNVDDEIEVVILDLDKEKNRISLGVKQLIPHPWESAVSKYKIGDIVEGKVVRLSNFGAFIELEPGVDGLVHISQITYENISKPSDVLNMNDTVKVKILNISPDERKMELSIKEADTSTSEYLDKYNEEDNFTIGDILNIKDTQDK